MLKLKTHTDDNNSEINVLVNSVIHNPLTAKKHRGFLKPKEPLRIMVVEDEKEHNELIKFVLDKKGYHVVAFDNALDALDYLKYEKVDIIISDIMMPKMNGIEFCSIVKKKYENIYFILLTAKGEIKDKVVGLDIGADEYIVKPFDIMEFIARVRAGERIVNSKKQLTFLNEKLEKIADIDALTKTKNRRYFQNIINTELDRANRYNHTIALLMLDIDFFKKINDRYGHLAGDHVLKGIAQLISGSVRASDIVCRYGGEEFVIILPETNPKLAFHTAEKIRTLIEKTIFKYDQNSIAVTVSIGIVIKTPSVDMNKKQLLELADKALYKAKDNGKNKSVIYKWYRINDLQAN